MSFSNVSQVMGQAENEFDSYMDKKVTSNTDLGKEDFLTLLITQLENQDPLNPMEDKEFTAQMAQFTSLEQLMNISEGITSLNQTSVRQEMVSAVSFIGKHVKSSGYDLSKQDGVISGIYYTLEEPISEGFINIYDSAGGIVNTVQLGQKQAGEYEFEWDGKNYKGATVADGVYSIGMAAEDADGRTVNITTQISGEVSGVHTIGTSQYLRLKDGRMVDFLDVNEVVDPTTKTTDTTSNTSS